MIPRQTPFDLSLLKFYLSDPSLNILSHPVKPTVGRSKTLAWLEYKVLIGDKVKTICHRFNFFTMPSGKEFDEEYIARQIFRVIKSVTHLQTRNRND